CGSPLTRVLCVPLRLRELCVIRSRRARRSRARYARANHSFLMRTRNRRSTSVERTSPHSAESNDHSREACATVSCRPGISLNSACARRKAASNRSAAGFFATSFMEVLRPIPTLRIPAGNDRRVTEASRHRDFTRELWRRRRADTADRHHGDMQFLMASHGPASSAAVEIALRTRFLECPVEPLREFRAMRYLEARSARLNAHGWMDVRTELTSGGAFTFDVIAE